MLMIKINVSSTVWPEGTNTGCYLCLCVCCDNLTLLLSLAEQEDNTEVCEYSGDFCSRWAPTLPSSSSGSQSFQFLCLQV